MIVFAAAHHPGGGAAQAEAYAMAGRKWPPGFDGGGRAGFPAAWPPHPQVPQKVRNPAMKAAGAGSA